MFLTIVKTGGTVTAIDQLWFGGIRVFGRPGKQLIGSASGAPRPGLCPLGV